MKKFLIGQLHKGLQYSDYRRYLWASSLNAQLRFPSIPEAVSYTCFKTLYSCSYEKSGGVYRTVKFDIGFKVFGTRAKRSKIIFLNIRHHPTQSQESCGFCPAPSINFRHNRLRHNHEVQLVERGNHLTGRTGF